MQTLLPALKVKNLIKRYGEKVAVDNISFTVEKCEFFGFLGPNGAGKTSTINVITGIGKFNSGEIIVFGHDVVKDYREARRKIGLSPQEFNIDFFAPAQKVLDFVGGGSTSLQPHRNTLQRQIGCSGTFLGWLFNSIEMLPEKFQIVMRLNPFFYFVDGLRYAMTGVSESSRLIGLALIFGLILVFGLGVWILFQRGYKIRT